MANYVCMCHIAASRWPNDINSAADNAIFKNRAQNIECSFGCVACSAVLFKSNVANILFFNFSLCEEKLIVTASTCPYSFSKKNGLIMPLDQSPHQTLTRFGCIGFSIYACGFFVLQMRQFCLFTYSPRSKSASSEKLIFFCQNQYLL